MGMYIYLCFSIAKNALQFYQFAVVICTDCVISLCHRLSGAKQKVSCWPFSCCVV